MEGHHRAQSPAIANWLAIQTMGFVPASQLKHPNPWTVDSVPSVCVTQCGVSIAYLRRAGIPEGPAQSSSCHPPQEVDIW